FRQEQGRALATLIRAVGDFDLAEEAVQEAFLIALDRWPRTGLPDNPGAWITTAARNKAIDRIRRERRLRDKTSLVEAVERARASAAPHPARPPERLAGVLSVLYLVFNEGYASTEGPLVRTELCAEAIRLTRVVADLLPREPDVAGLLALMLLQHSRRAARVD